MLIDTHCHIYLEQFEEDIDDVLSRAVEAGVAHIFMPSINLGSLDKMDRISHDDIAFHKMAGIHPTDINDGAAVGEKRLLECCIREEIVAVGETGLDYYWSDEHKEKQQESLRTHCKVAKSVDKPIILHNRESTKDMLDIIEEEQDGSMSGIWHCFNGSESEGQRAIGLGLHLGIGGVLTFKNGGVDTTVAKLPIETMVLETDAPYLAPAPNRGKRNEPAFVRLTAQKLAEVQGMTIEEVERVTTENALRLFGTDA